MITANGKKIFQSYAGAGQLNAINYNNSAVQMGNASSSLTLIYAVMGFSVASPGSVLSMGQGYTAMDVGFGDTPESENDYKLENGNTESNLLQVVSYGRNSTALGDLLNLYANFRNNGASNVVVKEIGIYGNPTNAGASSGGIRTVLLYRKVLETPVIIAPGETYSFIYNVRFKS